MIQIVSLKDQDCKMHRVDYTDGVDLLIEQPNGDILHLMLTKDQAKELGAIK